MRRHCGDEAAQCEECCTKIRRKAEVANVEWQKNASRCATYAAQREANGE